MPSVACAKCKKKLSGAEEKARIEVRTQDGVEVAFGNIPGHKKVSEATGKLKAIYHYGCYFLVVKAVDKRRDGLRYLDESPTVYEASVNHKNKDDVSEIAKARREKAESRFAELQLALTETIQEIAVDFDLSTVGRSHIYDLEELLREAELELTLAKRQEEIAVEREKEETPTQWNDWRNPTTIEI